LNARLNMPSTIRPSPFSKDCKPTEMLRVSGVGVLVSAGIP